MNKIFTIASVTAAIAIFVTTLFLMTPETVIYTAPIEEPKVETKKLTHRQEVWISVLEWCESRGYPDAVNPMDSDGKPSFGGFQFREATLNYFAEKYGVATTTLMDYDTQRAVVEQMVLHRDEIRWETQFPACVRKYGAPPKD